MWPLAPKAAHALARLNQRGDFCFLLGGQVVHLSREETKAVDDALALVLDLS
jgi:hypothetical protein